MICLKSKYLFLEILFFIGTSSFTIPSNYHANNDTSNNKFKIWYDDFSSNKFNDWMIGDELTNEKSNWFVEKGYLIQNTDFGNTKDLIGTNIINGNIEWEDYVVRVNLICTDDDYIGILFRYVDNNNYYRFLLSSQRKDIRIDKRVNGNFILISNYTEEEWMLTKFSVTIILKGNRIKVYLADKQFFDLTDNQFSRGKIGFVSISNLGSFFDDITVYSEYHFKKIDTKAEITRGPYLQSVLENNATIMWNTSIPLNSIVEYGLKPEPAWIKISEELQKEHEIKLENLSNETRYYYRIRSGDLKGEWYSFKTAIKKDSPFSFIVYGDNQMNFLRHEEIINQFSKHEFDFIISCGDVVQRGPRNDWDIEFFSPLKNVLNEKPIYAVIGNHELNDKNYYRNFANPDSEHENYFSFKYGNSFFIFIDNPRAAYPNKPYYTDCVKGSPQYEWLGNQLSSEKAQDAQWLFVVSHIPSYVLSSQEIFPICKENFVPLFEKYGVDFSFSGHVHGYERGLVNSVNYIVSAGGGGAQNKNNYSLLKKIKNFKLVYNFCRLNINGRDISFEAYDINNQIIDRIELTK